jgi:RNA polymerase sigma-70 factor (ECF subfamily)
MDHSASLAPLDAKPNRDLSDAPATDAGRYQDWLRRSRSGDPDAFDRLVERHFAEIQRLARSILGDRDGAEDAAQEIFIKAWSSIRRFNGASSFGTWLHSVGLRHCLDLARKRRRESARLQPFSEEKAESPFSLFGIESPADSRWEIRIAVQDALARLPEKLRIVLSLHYCAGYSIREIAAELRLSPSAVHSRLRIALERMERMMRDTEE